jgi:hypothetical protein
VLALHLKRHGDKNLEIICCRRLGLANSLLDLGSPSHHFRLHIETDKRAARVNTWAIILNHFTQDAICNI